jgi:hypothetical protein
MHIFRRSATGFSTGLFNTSVENTVEKRRGLDVNGSSANASAFCTGDVAGTFVLAVEKEFDFNSSDGKRKTR